LVGLPETGVSMFRWTHANEKGDFSFQAARHSHYLLSLILRPMEATAWANRRQIWAGPIARHTVRIVHPDEENRWCSSGAFDLLHIMIPRTAITQMADDAHDVRFTDPLYTPDEMVCQIGRQVLTIMEQGGPFVSDIADGLSHALMGYILRRYMLGGEAGQMPLPSSGQMRRVFDLVTENISHEISLHQMADAAGMSLFHFSRQFRKAVGTSPHRYVIARRIEKAKILLSDQRLSILEVSLECGFKDASHFTRVFRATVGMTPREFRAAN
jgi:AraC family transcriptional regulator